MIYLTKFTTQISTRESKVEELEGQLQQLRHTSAVGELDALAATPLSGLHNAITLLTSAIQVKYDFHFFDNSFLSLCNMRKPTDFEFRRR